MLMFPRNKPCVEKECLKDAHEFEAALRKPDDDVIYDVPPMAEFLNCGRCNILVCGYHSTAMVTWRDDKTGERHEVKYDPPLCKRCNWLSDNNGERGREPGWIASKCEIPW